jgi:hypothetical protein
MLYVTGYLLHIAWNIPCYMLQAIYCVSLSNTIFVRTQVLEHFMLCFAGCLLRIAVQNALRLVPRPFQSKSQFVLINFSAFGPADSVEL